MDFSVAVFKAKHFNATSDVICGTFDLQQPTKLALNVIEAQ